MAKVLILGGGVVGLSTGIMLAQQGYDVTVLERDNGSVPRSPEDAWHTWERRGVAQFRQPHYLHSAARSILDSHLPQVKQELLRAGCVTFDLTTLMPPFISDRSPRNGDERFVTVTGRRPTIEYAIAKAAETMLRVVRGEPVVELLTGTSDALGIPHITGVRTMHGREFFADLVIDTLGRNSKLPGWLESVGARRPSEEAEASAFIYYTRFFRSKTGSVPQCRLGLITHFDSFSLLTLPGDSDTWSVTVFIFSGDPALKVLRNAKTWTALVGACPLHAHWLDGEPITEVLAMGGITNRYRRFVVDGAPVVTGIVSVGDAWACTNPIGGRGIAMGLLHAVGTTEVVRRYLGDPQVLALAQDSMTEERLTPWYRNTVEFDRKRTAQIKATIEGRRIAPSSDFASALVNAMMYDADLFRASIEIASLLALPQEVMARPGVMERVVKVAGAHEAAVPPGPSRKAVLHLLE